MNTFYLLSFYVAAWLFSTPVLATDVVRYNISQQYNDPKQDYYIALLRMALNKSRERYGPYQLFENSFDHTPQGRTLDLVERGKLLDVHWSMTSKQRETQLGTVYVPLLKGMMGARLLLVREDTLDKLELIDSAAQLTNFTLGSGSDWPDTAIYEANGFVVTTSNASTLPKMFQQRRFDLFPRALHEPWTELSGYQKVTVAPRFALCYPAAMYFFVTKQNTRLKERLEYGLNQAIDDGSFDQLYFSHPISKTAIDKAQFSTRKTLKLHNPNLTSHTRDILFDARYTWKPIHQCIAPH